MTASVFNKVHKNGSVSYRVPGTTGAIYIAKSQLSAEFPTDTPPNTLDEALAFLVAPGADATEKSQEREAKRVEREAAKVAKAESAMVKAQERIAALQAKADAARERAEAAAAKLSA